MKAAVLSHLGADNRYVIVLCAASIALILFGLLVYITCTRSKCRNKITEKQYLGVCGYFAIPLAIYFTIIGNNGGASIAGILGVVCLALPKIGHIRRLQYKNASIEAYPPSNADTLDIVKSAKDEQLAEMAPPTLTDDESNENNQEASDVIKGAEFEPSDNPRHDLIAVGLKFKDKDLAASCMKRLAIQEKWSQEVELTKLNEFLHRHNLDDGISNLRELVTKENGWVMPALALVRHYIECDAYGSASEYLVIASDRARSSADRIQVERARAMYHKAIDEIDTAIKILVALIKDIETSEEKTPILYQIANCYRELKNMDAEAYYLEAAINCNPDYKDLRFRLAYLYDQNDEELLAMHHYSILLKQDRDYYSAYNNLGVIYGSLGLRGQNIAAWQAGYENGEGYPAGNLAVALAEQGFWNEAEEYLDSLPDEERKAKRIVEARGIIQKKKQSEELLQENFEVKAKNIHMLYQGQSLAILRSDSQAWSDSTCLVGVWEDGDKTLEIAAEETGVCGTLTTEKKRYSVEITKIGSMIKLLCSETHYKPEDLGLAGVLGGGALFGGGASTTPDSEGWVATSRTGRSLLFLGAESISFKVFLATPDTMKGYRMTAAKTDIEEVSFSKVALS